MLQPPLLIECCGVSGCRSLPASEQLRSAQRSYSAAFQPITSLVASRRAASAGSSRMHVERPWSGPAPTPDRSFPDSLEGSYGMSPSEGRSAGLHIGTKGAHAPHIIITYCKTETQNRFRCDIRVLVCILEHRVKIKSNNPQDDHTRPAHYPALTLSSVLWQ